MADVFFASSTEYRSTAANIAVALRRLLPPTWTVTGWWDSTLFPAGSTVVESIEKIPECADTAIIFFTPDDGLSSRGNEYMSPRDNVLFEAGYFMSRFGRHRCAVARIGNAKIPTDLNGITLLLLSEGFPREISRDAEAIFSWLAGQESNARMKVLAEDAMKRADKHSRAGVDLNKLTFPLSAYPFFLNLLLDEPEIEIRATEVIGDSQVCNFEHVYDADSKKFKCTAFDAQSFHWYLWSDCPFQEQCLDNEKIALLQKTKNHPKVSRFIYLREPSTLPKPLFQTIYFYASEFLKGSPKAQLHFVIGKQHPIKKNEMHIRCHNDWFSAQRVQRSDDSLLVSIERRDIEPVVAFPNQGCLTAEQFVQQFSRESESL